MLKQVFLAAWTLALAASVFAENGVTDKEIRIGSTVALTGGIAKIGSGFASGAEAYYRQVNIAGGVNGRTIVFTPKDDGYQPTRAVENAKALVEHDKVFALVGSVGTPVVQAIMPIVDSSGIPLLFTGTGGSIAYPEPPKKNLFQLGLSYAGEASSLIHFVVDSLKMKKIGVFFQDDAFGAAGRAGVEKTLSEYDLKVNGFGSYQRNTTDVDKAVDDLKSANPQVVYLQSVEKPAVEFIKKCLAKKFSPIFVGPSALGSVGLKESLSGLSVDMYLSDLVPPPTNLHLPVIKKFHQDMEAIGKPADTFSLNGYLGAMVFVEAVKRAGKNLTRATLLDALEKMHNWDLGGIKVDFNTTKHYGLSSNYIFHLHNGTLDEVVRGNASDQGLR